VKLTVKTLNDEFDKMLVMRPIFHTTTMKEALVKEDWERITEYWEEGPFKSACFEVRKPGGSFPSIKEIEQAYWQAVKDAQGPRSEQDDTRRDYEKRLQEENEIYAKILRLDHDKKRMILEQAEDDVDAALDKLEKRDDSGQIIRSAGSELAKLLRRHRDDSIKGRAIQIYRRDWTSSKIDPESP